MNKLKSETINLRTLEPEDIETLYEWENDTEVWRISGTLTPFSRETLRQFIADQQYDIYTTKQTRFIIEESQTLRPVGTIDLFDFDPANKRAGVGILIYRKEDRGHGFASAAIRMVADYCAKVLDMHQIYANIEAANTGSMRLFERLGFKVAGLKKEWNKSGDKWEDEYLLQLMLE